MNIQYKKGVIELFVLAMLKKEDQYGYDISEAISEKIQISPGTVYPILRKLKKEKLVITYLSETSNGPARKYYQLTEYGKKQYDEYKKEWFEFIKTASHFLEEEK
jgi:PadR family transcriptional regulator PadR